MRLKKINIRNYRQFEDIDIIMSEGLTILAGANNSGKTSIISLIKKMMNEKIEKYDTYDIPSSELKRWSDDMYEKFDFVFKNEQTTDDIYKIFFDEDGKEINRVIATEIRIQVDYDEQEDISLFADYIMDFDENKHSFYFVYKYELDNEPYIKKVNDQFEYLKDKFNRHFEEDESEEKIRNSRFLKDYLLQIYTSSVIPKVYFCDEAYDVLCPFEKKKQFVRLFNFNYIEASRPLDDEETDKHRTLTKQMMKNAEEDVQWNELIKQLPDNLYDKFRQDGILDHIRTVSVNSLQTTIDELDKTKGNGTSKILLDIKMMPEDISNFINGVTSTSYEVDGYYLSEASQGLGYSNMIYMHLQLSHYVQSLKEQKVNVFFIEEPESHMHPQMQKVFMSYLSKFYKHNKIQGLITTHSNEMVRTCGMANLRVIRKTNQFKSELFDMSKFKANGDSDDEELNKFYEWFFEIGYSEIVFADKVIVYEGDTERLMLRKLLTLEKYSKLNNQYIAFIQAGGEHGFKYKDILEYLKIKSLFYSDIDYSKDCFEISSIIGSDVKNDTIKHFYGYSLTEKDFKVKNIYEWYSSKSNMINPNLAVFFQTENDGYARTLEEALLFKIYNINATQAIKRSEWKNLKSEKGLSFSIPRNKEGETDSDFYCRDIVNSTSGKKTDFMYSLIIKDELYAAEPNYIKEGLEWLMN